MAVPTHLDIPDRYSLIIMKQAKKIIGQRSGNECLSVSSSSHKWSTQGLPILLSRERQSWRPNDILDFLELSMMIGDDLQHLHGRAHDDGIPIQTSQRNIQDKFKADNEQGGKIEFASSNWLRGQAGNNGFRNKPGTDPKPEPQPIDPGYGSRTSLQVRLPLVLGKKSCNLL